MSEWTHEADLLGLQGRAVHNQCTKAVLHSVPAAESSLFRVAPLGKVASHRHSDVWDLFIGVGGNGEIAIQEDDEIRVVPLALGSFCAVGPNTIHEVRNTAPLGGEDLLFVLVHAPFDTYDHKAAAFRQSATHIE